MTNKEAIEWLRSIDKKYIHGGDEWFDERRHEAIDFAIESIREARKAYEAGYAAGSADGYAEGKTARGDGVKREFIEILAQYTPDDLVTYPEYKGKPYYSIVFNENGELINGFGTYKIEVLSRYLREYFNDRAGYDLRQGSWIWGTDEKIGEYCKCSICGMGMGKTPFDYCPNCGAHMGVAVCDSER